MDDIVQITARLTEVEGYFDNERRRESNQSEAIRSGSMYFETRYDFRRRIGATDTGKLFADEEEEDGDEDGLDAAVEEPDPADGTDSEDDDDLGISMPGTFASQNQPEPPPPPPQPDAHQKRRDKQLRKGLEIIQAGAVSALWPADKSTEHAIPKDVPIPEVEDNNFRLTPHQRDGVGRMLHLEEKRKAWVNADEPGLGKTVQAISVVIIDHVKFPNGGPTLCVVPKGLLGYWQSEFKTRAPSLKVLLFHGQTAKSATRADITKHDVIITTYETLVSQYKPYNTAQEDWPLIRLGERQKEVKVKSNKRGKGKQPKTRMQKLEPRRADAPLYSVEFRRILLDEGHRIKNPDTLVSRAVAAITAMIYGIITGTLLQNDYTDFYAIARFLHLTPWDNRDLFNACFVQKASKEAETSAAAYLDKNMEFALACLRSCVTIRRLKNQIFDGKPIAGVQEPSRRDCPVDLTPDEQRFQDDKLDMWDPSWRAVLKSNAKHHQLPVIPSRPDIFADLTEGQLQAIHPILTTASYGDLGIEHADSASVDRDIHDEDGQHRSSKHIAIPGRGELLDRFDMASKDEQMKSGAKRREEFKNRLRSKAGSEESECVLKVVGLIRKILSAEKERLQSFEEGMARKEEEARGKIILFCNFLNASDLVAIALERCGIPFYEINGYCSDKERDEMFRNFEELDAQDKPKDFAKPHIKPDAIRVLLASVRVAAEGFNLVHATHIIMLGPGWNPFVRIQAISRAHRIGQTRQVQVYDIFADKSMHLRVRRVQEVKLKKVQGVMEDRQIRVAAAEIQKWTLSTFKGFVSLIFLVEVDGC
jgi:SNF2 family DNA or RNA helicase